AGRALLVRQAIPDAYREIARAGDPAGAVGGEGHLMDGGAVAVPGADGRARGPVPEAKRVVCTRPGPPRAARREDQAVHTAPLGQDGGLLPRRGVPQADCAVLRTGGEPFAIRSHGEGEHETDTSFEEMNLFRAGQVPNANRWVLRSPSRGQP